MGCFVLCCVAAPSLDRTQSVVRFFAVFSLERNRTSNGEWWEWNVYETRSKVRTQTILYWVSVSMRLTFNDFHEQKVKCMRSGITRISNKLGEFQCSLWIPFTDVVKDNNIRKVLRARIEIWSKLIRKLSKRKLSISPSTMETPTILKFVRCFGTN